MSCDHKASLRKIYVPARIMPLLESIGGIATRHGISSYAVGGCVRDWLLGESQTTDIDIAIDGDGIQMAREVSNVFKSALKIHPQFGTATVTIQNPTGLFRKRCSRPNLLRLDFSSCRKESYAQPAAYPRVFAGTIEDDLFRRDFTINAMAIAIGPVGFGSLIDPFLGACDLRRKRLRFLHDKSFIDDPSRILRGIRFASRFGLRWEPNTRHAAKQAIASGALGLLNKGRLFRELERMLYEPDPRSCLLGFSALLRR